MADTVTQLEMREKLLEERHARREAEWRAELEKRDLKTELQNMRADFERSRAEDKAETDKKLLAERAARREAELRAELEKRKKDTSGKKVELLDRLAAAVEKEKEKFNKKHLEQMIADFEDMKPSQLKKELDSRDLSTKGSRDDFMERLTEAAKKESKKAYDKKKKKSTKSDSDSE